MSRLPDATPPTDAEAPVEGHSRQNYDAAKWFPPGQAAADDFERYSEDYPIHFFREGMRRLQRRSHAFLVEDDDAAALASILRKRLMDGTPTSAIRISDGEGNVLFGGEDSYPALRDYAMEKISSMHFGRGSRIVNENASLFVSQMQKAIESADVLGVPNVTRVVRAFRREPVDMDVRAQVGNRRGLAVAFELAQRGQLSETVVADAFFSRQLLGHYQTIIEVARTIVLVTCHDDLVAPMQAMSGVSDVRLIAVPLQSSQMRGVTNAHFPDAYHRICQQIAAQPEGALFLIGAGPLAKHYCALAKKAGGIAIDVGAVLDFWAGRSGRGTIKKETLERWSIIGKEIDPNARGLPSGAASSAPTLPVNVKPAGGPVFVHIGLAKTGTTTLQRNYFSRTPAVNYLGKKANNAEMGEQNRALTRRGDRGYDAALARQVFEPHLRNPGVAVFSDEDLSVYKFLHPQQMGGRIGKLFPDLRLIYVPRRPMDWIKSQYFFRLSTYTLECLNGINAWLDTHFARADVGSDITEIRFAETFRAFHDAAGRPPYLILPYEMMANDIDGFIAAIESFMGLDGELRVLTDDAAKNPKKVRMGHGQANFIRVLSLYHQQRETFHDRVAHLARHGSRDMQREFVHLRASPDARLADWIEYFQSIERRVFPLVDDDPEVIALLSEFNDYEIRPDLQRRIDEIAAREAAVMKKDYNVDLAGYGY